MTFEITVMVHDWKAIQGRKILFEKRLGSSKFVCGIADINLGKWETLSVNVWLKPPPAENDEQAELSRLWYTIIY